MNPRISKWLLILCATLLGACSADTDLLGPASVQAPLVTRPSIAVPPPSTVEAGPQAPRNIIIGQSPRRRYAMAAN